VPQNGSVDVFLSRSLKNASVVRAAGLPGALEMVRTGRADVAATHKPDLFEAEKRLPGARILEGSPGGERQAMVIPKGRDAGLAYARRFVEDAKYDGFVQAALERAGLRGATVPLAEPRR
jgi:polar amino acid transport system substrate-binding protein